MSERLKKLFVILGVSLVFLGGYFVFVNSQSPVLEGDMVQVTELMIMSEKVYADLDKISRLHIDESLFTDARFTSLKDTRVPIKEIGTGRLNPFSSLD